MKPFSINTKGHFILFKERENKSLCKIKRAPKKPILKPFQEEQQPSMGHSCMKTQTDQQIRGCRSLSFHHTHCHIKKVEGDEAHLKSFGECCSSRQTWREENNATAVLFTICTFS